MRYMGGNWTSVILAREGDFLETVEGAIFEAKGLVHPPDGTISFLRYFPDAAGQRLRRGVAFSKVYGIAERMETVKKRFPNYLHFDRFLDESVCLVPCRMVRLHYKPIEFLEALRLRKSLDALELDALALSHLLHEEAGASWRSFGISGSLLLGLHQAGSDLDLIFYGDGLCRQVYEKLGELVEAGRDIRRYDDVELRRLYAFRVQGTKIRFADFLRNERHKVMQGRFRQRDYFVRFVKDWGEINTRYGDEICRKIGYGKFRFVVTGSSEAIFTPNIYLVEEVSSSADRPIIREILSFRGRFCEQAKEGDIVEAQGKIESVRRLGKLLHRLVIGGAETDYLIRIEETDE